MKKNWGDFLEDINHEIHGCDIKIPYKGYRIDEIHGIKKHCFNILSISEIGRKSCDYFQETSNTCVCIEFSDLLRQYEQHPIPHDLLIQWNQELLDSIPNNNGSKKKALRLFSKLTYESQIEEEVIQKIEGTDFLLETIQKSNDEIFLDANNTLLTKNKVFVLIWHFSSQDDNGIYRVLDNIRTNINNKLISRKVDHINKEVYITTVEDFFM